MSITTYSELKTAVADFLNRQDLTTIVPTFISLAEAGFNRTLRHFSQETIATISMDAARESLPTDWVETIRFALTDLGEIELVSHAMMMDLRATEEGSGTPRYFTHSAGQIEVYPAPGSATSGELLYFAKVPALSDIATTNWLLTAAPDVYLYGALLHSAPYLKDDARVPVWQALYGQAMAELQLSSDRAKYSGPLRMKTKLGN